MDAIGNARQRRGSVCEENNNAYEINGVAYRSSIKSTNAICEGNVAKRPLECSFEYEGCTYFYQVWGNPDLPPVVLLHGFMQSCKSWAFIADSLARRFCVYAPDFMGHGLSDKSANFERYTYEDMAASIDYFLRNVVCVPGKKQNTSLQRAHIIGYSMGGRIALRLLEISDDMLASVVLESCNLGCASMEERKEAACRNEGWISRIQNDGMEAFVDYWEMLPMFATQKESGLDKLLHVSRASNDANSMVLCLRGAGKQAMPLTNTVLDAIRAKIKEELPILYIYGNADAKSVAVAAQLEPLGAAVSSIPAGHNVHLEAPMLYLKEVVHFLTCIERNLHE